MTNTTNTAAASIAALVETATAAWDGLSWDSSPATLLHMIESGKPVDTDEDLTAGCYWPDNGSHTSQELARDWRDLLDAVNEVSTAQRPVEYPAEVLAEAQRLADAEEAAVTERAEAAAELGESVTEHVAAGRWDDAIKAAEQAAQIEREFGDAPAWGRLADAIRALPEYLAAVDAAESYQDDDRGDEEIAADNTEARAIEICGGTISALGEATLGITDATREVWCSRYVAAYQREIADWCAA